MNIFKQRKGFTLVELLVVISIIALLSSFAVIGLGSARKKGRDAKRLADIKQIQTALEFYYSDHNRYPVASTPIVLGSPTANKLCGDGFVASTTTCSNPDQVYMRNVPANPTPGGQDFTYTSADGTTYSITFKLEADTGNLSAAQTVTATPEGFKQP